MTEMRRFQGLVNQLAPFDSELAMNLAPLRHHLKGNNDNFALNDDEKRALKDAKERLSLPVVRAYYQPGQTIELYTDAACTAGYGSAVL